MTSTRTQDALRRGRGRLAAAAAVAVVAALSLVVTTGGAGRGVQVLSPANGGGSPGGVLRVTDVSPDRPFGSLGNSDQPKVYGSDASGRTVSIVVDPTDRTKLYAASEAAGVWASTDAGHTWHQSSAGILNGLTNGAFFGNDGGSVSQLAIDATNPQRLLYASTDDDGRKRTGPGVGGLYVSTSGAFTWSRVDLAGLAHSPCASPNIFQTAFAGGIAYVRTACGLYTSSDLTTWTDSITTGPFADSNSNFPFAVASASSIYACDHGVVSHSIDGGQSWVSISPVPVPKVPPKNPADVNCRGLAVVPDDPANKVLMIDAEPNVWIVDFSNAANPAASSLGFSGREVSGTQAVYAVARRSSTPGASGPGKSYDVFATSGLYPYQYDLGYRPNHWVALSQYDSLADDKIHSDSWGMAFPPGYDPIGGDCSVFAGSDGGVYADSHTSGSACSPDTDTWVRASSGLHVESSTDVTGINRVCVSSGVLDTPRVCPALYEASGDNATWGSVDGGSTWQAMSDLGDTGAVFTDPGLITQMATTRNSQIEQSVSTYGPPSRWQQASSGFQAASITADPPPPPQQPTFNEIQTLATETAPSDGDFLAVDTGTLFGNPFDQLARNQHPHTQGANGWIGLTATTFASGSIVEVQPSGGHETPTVYLRVLTAPGQTSTYPVIEVGKVDAATQQVDSWAIVSNSLTDPLNFFADPYDPSVIYATASTNPTPRSDSDTRNAGDLGIYATTTGGKTWHLDQTLSSIATNNGEYGGVCPAQVEEFPVCMLENMQFDQADPNIRVATLFPGGLAFSRDAGKDWIPLVGATGPIDMPTSTWYDPGGGGAAPAIYVSMLGRGIERLDAPFATLEAIEFHLAAPPSKRPMDVVDSAGTATPMTPVADGYTATELVDTRNSSLFTYQYDTIDSHGLTPTGPPHTRLLTAGQRASGVAQFSDTLPPAVLPPATTPTTAPSTTGTTLFGSATGPGAGIGPGGAPTTLAPNPTPSPTPTAGSVTGSSPQGGSFAGPAGQAGQAGGGGGARQGSGVESARLAYTGYDESPPWIAAALIMAVLLVIAMIRRARRSA